MVPAAATQGITITCGQNPGLNPPGGCLAVVTYFGVRTPLFRAGWFPLSLRFRAPVTKALTAQLLPAGALFHFVSGQGKTFSARVQLACPARHSPDCEILITLSASPNNRESASGKRLLVEPFRPDGFHSFQSFHHNYQS